MEKVFKLYSRYYNLFYADKKYDQEVDYIDRLIKKFSPSASTILEYGSGTGGHGLLLQQKGYKIQGIERSEEMANIARSKGFNCEVGDIVDTKVDSQFDICLALFHVISYINPNDDLIRLFKKTRANLKPNGYFIFDVWFTPAVLGQKPEVRVKDAEDEHVTVTRVAQPVIFDKTNVVQVNYRVFIKSKKDGETNEISEAHNMRHFSVPELELLAWQTGFELVRSEEFLTGNEPSAKTWGVTFILKSK